MDHHEAASRPNIVYVLADDMGYGDVSCLHPEPKFRTVHMDRLAAEGMTFTDAHSTSAICTPSRYSILTGRYNWRSAQKRGVLFGYDRHLIEDGRMTIASFLKQHGYTTACVGKWHLGFDWALNSESLEDVDFARPISSGPLSFGFDSFFGISGSLDMKPYVYIENDRVTALPDRIVPGSEGKKHWREGPIAPDFRHEEVLPTVTRKAVQFIHAQAGKDAPFFLYFPLPAPHAPILPSPEFQGASGTNEYGDFVMMVDDVVGQVMAALNQAGVADNTILIVTADNGCAPVADLEELAACGHFPSYHFRGHKADIYEGGHRIPMLLRWPARVRAGTVCDDIVCLVDLLATCADILGSPLPDNAGEDSVSNLPLWLETPGAAPIREATVHHSADGSLSIRQGHWKLEMCPGSGGWSYPKPGPECDGLPPIQLYDLSVDIGERRNVYDRHPDVVRHLTDLLTTYVRTGRSTPGAPQQNTGPRHWPQLSWMMEDGEE